MYPVLSHDARRDLHHLAPHLDGLFVELGFPGIDLGGRIGPLALAPSDRFRARDHPPLTPPPPSPGVGVFFVWFSLPRFGRGCPHRAPRPCPPRPFPRAQRSRLYCLPR